MAIEFKYVGPLILVLIISIAEIFCTDNSIPNQRQPISTNAWQQNGQTQLNPIDTKSTTAWPQLGQKRGQQISPNESPGAPPVWVRPTPPSSKRDFVSIPRPSNGGHNSRPFQPNPVEAPKNNPNADIPTWVRTTSPANNKRDFVSKPTMRSTVNKDPSVGNNGAPTWVRPTGAALNNRRDFVSSPKTPLHDNKKNENGNSNQGSMPVWARPTGPPRRDFVSSPRTTKLPPSNVASSGVAQLMPNQNAPAIKPSPTSSTTSSSPGPKPESTTPNTNDKLSEDNELREFSEALVKKDTNNALKYVTVNYQGKTSSSSTYDQAPQPLLSINSEAYNIPSIAKLILLHNNYILESAQNEVYTGQEKIEENNFLDTILATPVMQHTRNFLVKKGKISKDPKDFKDLLRTIWFNMYSRGGGKIGSSGFEHVFLAEIKNDAVSGLHNWIYFNAEENKQQANYLGYMKKLDFEKGAILKYHFNFHEKDKPVGSMFIGTSPEFEFALYSTCFILRPDQVCPLRLGGTNFIIRTYTYRYRGKNMIGSAFPEI